MWHIILYVYIVPALICTARAAYEYVKIKNTLSTEAEKKEALEKHIGPKFQLGFVPIVNIILAIRAIVD